MDQPRRDLVHIIPLIGTETVVIRSENSNIIQPADYYSIGEEVFVI